MRRPITIKARVDAAEAPGSFTGYASRFNAEPDCYGDVIARGAFAPSIAAHTDAATWPLMLWQHDTSEPIGVWTEIREDADGLFVRGELILETARGREAHALLKARALNGLSIGFRVIKDERRNGGGRLIKQVELLEISIVSLPALSAARVTDVKSAKAGETKAARSARQKEKAMDDENENEETGDVDARLADLEMGYVDVNETLQGHGERLEAIEETMGKVQKSASRIEQKLARPGAAQKDERTEIAPERKAFGSMLRRGAESLQPEEAKSLRVSEDTAGGYLAPKEFVAEVIKNLVEVSPVRQAARVGSTASGSVILPKRTGQPTANWVGETEGRTETGATYGQTEINAHEAACYVDVSQQLLEDSAVNVETEVAIDLAEEFGRLEGAAFVNGNGVKKPTGFMQADGVGETVNGHATALAADPLITLMYALPAYYRNNGVWMLNGTTLATVRKLKDGQGNYLWQPSYQAGQPETLLGRPVIEAVDMPDVAANAYPIVFGDFARAYRIYDRVQLAVMRDPYSQATLGLVRFHARRRVGGGTVLAEAIRKLKMST